MPVSRLCLLDVPHAFPYNYAAEIELLLKTRSTVIPVFAAP